MIRLPTRTHGWLVRRCLVGPVVAGCLLVGCTPQIGVATLDAAGSPDAQVLGPADLVVADVSAAPSPDLVVSLDAAIALDATPPADGAVIPPDLRPAVYRMVVGPEETVGVTTGLGRPSIALDSLGLPHVVADKGQIGGPMSVHIFHKTASRWTEALFVESCSAGCVPPRQFEVSRVYQGHLEIDGQDRGWVSVRFGLKDGGDIRNMGQGVWLVKNIATNPTQHWLALANRGEKNGNLSIDRSKPDSAVVMTKEGAWEEISTAGAVIARGRQSIGMSGETLRFLIRSRAGGQKGTWHAVMNGYSKTPSMYSSSLGAPVAWASNSRYYPGGGNDMIHPGLGLDGLDHRKAYMAVSYAGFGILFNIWDGSKLLFPADALPTIDAATPDSGNGSDRFGPQWAMAPGDGAFVCWTSANKHVRIRQVWSTGTLHDPVDVGPGSNCAVVLGPDGALHMSYVSDGAKGLRYRRIALR